MVTVFIMGKAHEVPAEATIMGAIEYSGYQIIRGAGCREGFCGACATVYRLPDDYKIYTGLACTTLVEDGMWLSQLPAIPAQRPVYDIYIQAAIRGDIEKVMDLSFDCLSCGMCAIRCPAEIVQYNVGLLARRLYGKYLAKESKQLKKRIKEVKEHKYDKEYQEFMKMKKENLKKKYYERDIE
jgi:succinate dehydrogenase/fumarate reductase-like Fe-S protein